MARATSTGMRILIGAGSSADAVAALRLIEGLPDIFRASLGGIFVEEPHTLETSRFPNRRVVTNSGMTMLAPDPTQIRTILQAEARAFRQALDRAKGQTTAESPFLRQQGELISTAIHAAKGWDVLVIGCRPLHRIRGHIVALNGAGGQSEQLRIVSESLSERFSTDCLSFAIGLDGGTGAPPPTPQRLRFETLDTAISALARTNALAVLVDLNAGPIQTQADLARVLDASRCPLVVIGASKAIAKLEHSTQIPTPPSDSRRGDDP